MLWLLSTVVSYCSAINRVYDIRVQAKGQLGQLLRLKWNSGSIQICGCIEAVAALRHARKQAASRQYLPAGGIGKVRQLCGL